MTNPTKQELIKFAKRNKLPMDGIHEDVCIYKRQRDELINDMQEVKRKAEAWDKVVEIYQAQYEEGLTHNEVVDKIGYIIHDLERT